MQDNKNLQNTDNNDATEPLKIDSGTAKKNDIQPNFTKNNLNADNSNNENQNNNNLRSSIDKDKEINTQSNNPTIKPKKEIPIEKKPFKEFINDHLIPSLVQEFKTKGFKVEDINLKNTTRPIAGDECWVIYCEIKDICNFWLSFEKEDISSTKSISLSKPKQKPSIIESFLIDEKRITLKLIISRVLQRLNGQKLIGVN